MHFDKRGWGWGGEKKELKGFVRVLGAALSISFPWE